MTAKSTPQNMENRLGCTGRCVHFLRGAGADQGRRDPAPPPAENVTVVTGEPTAFLRALSEPIDLLYLDGWQIGTQGYQQRHGG